jgi:hypothetical protein
MKKPYQKKIKKSRAKKLAKYVGTTLTCLILLICPTIFEIDSVTVYVDLNFADSYSQESSL